mgnify:CR=1 FL=1
MVYLYLLLIGLVVGSFVNVVIYRVPIGRQIVTGRSSCTRCRQILAWYDLIPIFSYLILHGRCRYCGQTINWWYLVGELFISLAFVFSYYWFGDYPISHRFFVIFLLIILFTLLMTDLKYLILPDGVILAGFIGAMGFGLAEKYGIVANSWSLVTAFNFLSALSLFLILYLVWFFSKGKWLGFGDVKFAALVGLIFGFNGGIFIIYLAVVMGGILGVSLLLLRQANLSTKLPFGSFISLAGMIYIFTGTTLAQWINLNLIFR